MPYYILVTLLFAVGIVFGALAINTLEPGQLEELTVFIEQFFSELDVQLATSSGLSLLRASLNLELKTLALIFLLGLTVIGIPVILAVVFIRGFVIGFTVGFLAYERGLRGIAFALAAVFPQNLFAVPAVVLAGVTGIVFSLFILRRRRRQWRTNLLHEFAGYAAIFTLAVAGVTAGALVKAYVSPVLMGLVHRLLF
jgi:stage II sporulation protein M